MAQVPVDAATQTLFEAHLRAEAEESLGAGRIEAATRLRRLGEIVEPINDKAGKPVNIAREIGRRPILAVGNSDGDLEMLQYSAGHGSRSLQVLIHHDDPEREYAYDHGAEKALAAVAEQGWVRVDMKRDFRRIFPFDAP